MPPFIEGGYKVRSKETGVASDDLIFTSQKYILDVKKHLATIVIAFSEDKGHGGNYQAWRQTFSNAVGEYRYTNDLIMGEFLRSRISQDVARTVSIALGKDANGSPLYWTASATTIDDYLQKSLFATIISEHKLNEEMSKPQSSSELPVAYVRARQILATPIYESGDATEQFLASQILTGFTSFWKKALFIKFAVREEKVYYSIGELLKDVRILYDLHLKTGGSLTEPIFPNRQGSSGNYQANGYQSSNTNGSGAKRQFDNMSDEPLSEAQWRDLPRTLKFGGHRGSRGQTYSCACTLCYRLGHTFEYCVYKNGYIQGGPPMERHGIPRPPPKKLGQQGPLLRLTQ
jgi:hypothetical protein